MSTAVSGSPDPGASGSLDLPVGLRIPAETARHECTLVAWPTAERQADLWGAQLAAARAAHTAVIEAIADHERVIVIVDPEDAASLAAAHIDQRDDVEVFVAGIDDSWIRDSGPVVVCDRSGTRHALHFGFNAWGDKHHSYADDRTIGARVAVHLGLPVHEVPLVLEGGSVTSDGAGTLVTTERCLLNPNRNPDHDRSAIEAVLRDTLGATRVVWLADAIAEDDGTDGHVDNVVAFTAPGRALLQGCDDVSNPNHAIALDNRRRLEGGGVTVEEIPTLPYTQLDGRRLPVPYVNFYVANGVVVVPVSGAPTDTDALEQIASHYPGREVVGVDARALAYGGGGVHCITQPVPAGP